MYIVTGPVPLSEIQPKVFWFESVNQILPLASSTMPDVWVPQVVQVSGYEYSVTPFVVPGEATLRSSRAILLAQPSVHQGFPWRSTMIW